MEELIIVDRTHVVRETFSNDHQTSNSRMRLRLHSTSVRSLKVDIRLMAYLGENVFVRLRKKHMKPNRMKSAEQDTANPDVKAHCDFVSTERSTKLEK